MAKVPSRVLRIALILSLALNLAVIGLVAGAVVRFRDGGPPQRFDFSLGPLGRALEPGDRRAIGQALRDRRDLHPGRPLDWRAGLDELAAILVAEPFDPEALGAYLANIRGQGAALIAAGQEVMVDRIAAMSAEERAALADRVRAEGRGHGRSDRDRDGDRDGYRGGD